jgi:hypothetical protein
MNTFFHTHTPVCSTQLKYVSLKSFVFFLCHPIFTCADYSHFIFTLKFRTKCNLYILFPYLFRHIIYYITTIKVIPKWWAIDKHKYHRCSTFKMSCNKSVMSYFCEYTLRKQYPPWFIAVKKRYTAKFVTGYVSRKILKLVSSESALFTPIHHITRNCTD